MAAPRYNPGHVLTAAEINDTLVNDDGAELEAYLTQMRQEINEKVTELPTHFQTLKTSVASIEATLSKLQSIAANTPGA
ncbi:hypothetical protein [Mobiluncus porci]|uniref:Uncharacterized protein n=1 Tax=Mobiluncus porci TaxID=2652278 RepID=A0A7K0K366_9ACTO|nr:hypothetical protein [Mobiluncus porci]MST49500.1 hypothetical protein [Mobiluncus porci]